MRPPSRISQELAEALPARAEQVLLGDARALERQLARVGRAPAELLHRRRDHVPGRAVRDDDVRDLAVARDRGDRHAGGDVGAGVRDEDLRAVDDPFAVLEAARWCVSRPRRSPRSARSARTRRASPEASSEATRASAPRAEVVDRERAERVVRSDGDRDRRVDARQLLDRDRVGRACRCPRRRTPRGSSCPSARARPARRRARTGSASRGRAPRRPARPSRARTARTVSRSSSCSCSRSKFTAAAPRGASSTISRTP